MRTSFNRRLCRGAVVVAALASSVAAVGCGSRPEIWNERPSVSLASYGLTGSVAVVDDDAHRAVMLKAGVDQTLDRRVIPLGHHVVHVETSADHARLFVLTAGDTPRRSPDDQLAALTVIDGSLGAGTTTVRTYPLATPLSGLAIDPLGKWAVVYAGDGSNRAFVENPNLLLVVDLEHDASPVNPVARTLRSFGGAPQRITFSQPLTLTPAGGPRRLLVVESQQDLSLLDLDHVADSPQRPDITVPLTSGGGVRVLRPAGVVIDDGDPARTDDARIGVRISNDTNVLTINLAAVTPTADALNDFLPKLNLTDVGGAASDIAFVRTDGGLRLAALVPSASKAVLVDPDTSITTEVALPRAYARIGLVTNAVAATAVSTSNDVALLWSGASGASLGVALWSLGTTAGAPYRSVEVLGVDGAIAEVTDVPRGNPELKILTGSSASSFYVLNLRNRTVAPLTTQASVALSLASSGDRVWAYRDGTADVASVDLKTLNPIPVVTDRPIAAVFEIEATGGGHALVAMHDVGGIGATVFDALAPDTATARAYAGLLLEGL